MLCYLADISSMCRLASWQAETTGALGMLSVQEISFILINATPNPPPAILLESWYIFLFYVSACLSLLLCLFLRISFVLFLFSSLRFVFAAYAEVAVCLT